jgi:hypothetical protein
VRCRFLEGTRTEVAGSGESCIDVRHAHLDEVRHGSGAWWDLVGASVRDDDGAVRPDAQLSAVPVADADALLESERGLEPRNRRSHIRIDQHRSYRRRWCGAIRQHAG